MHRVVLAIVVPLLAAAAPARAQEAGTQKGTFGIGLIVGEPTGASAKLFLTDKTAIDAAVGGTVVTAGVHAHADFLWHPLELASEDTFVLPAYVGVGARLLSHDRGDGQDRDLHLGVRGVAGMAFDFRTVPLDVFVEIAGVLDYRSAGDDHGGGGLDLNLGAGVRYYP